MHSPTMPKASNEELDLARSAVVSRDAGATDAPPYLISAGGEGRCPLADRGWMRRPSTAAQMMALRARPGILGVWG